MLSLCSFNKVHDSAHLEPSPPLKTPKVKREFDSSRYSTRLIALKFAYLGQQYNGFEHHANNATPLPTIEEKLWQALTKTKLIFPTGPGEVNWDGCDYSKCGRTDKGVSAFGQVIGIRVRSNKPKDTDGEDDFDSVNDEIPYPRILNRVLPDDIRVLAWCPSPPPDFSARFSCRERRYRYFFTQPAFAPLPGKTGIMKRRTGDVERDGWLNIEAMRKAASYFQGSHDFRNFCKVDPGKQITNFVRNITYASIEEARSCDGVVRFLGNPGHTAVMPTEAKVYTFVVYGSAFLWHQVRHMAAMLFLVGQGLEPASIIQELLDVEQNPRKPIYEMADDAPLVLWDCVFPSANSDKGGLEWVFTDGQAQSKDRKQSFSGSGDGRYGPGGLNEVLWEGWRSRKIDEVLAGSLLDVVAEGMTVQASRSSSVDDAQFGNPGYAKPEQMSTRIFDGGNGPRLKGVYVPMMKRPRTELVETVNARYLQRKGLAGTKTPPTPATDETGD